jgi:glycosyltransferase involved in cell wall biosynthesis
MKILYIAHYRENSGWSEFAKHHILALDAIGVDVVPRQVKLNDEWNEPHPRIEELEKKSAEGCDVIIQCLLPHHYQYQGGAKNIGVYFTETSDFTYSSWPSHINMMDEAWVTNQDAIEVAKHSGIEIPVKQVSPALDLSKYTQDYQIANDIKEQNGNEFLFYFIGDFRRRKNLSAALKAFHIEFGPHEPANIVIKTTKYGIDSQRLRQDVINQISAIKTGLRLYPSLDDYKKEIIITDHLTDAQMGSLHKTCDCLVAPSFGEALGLVVLDGMGFGNYVISTDIGGPSEYILHGQDGFLTAINNDICFGVSEDTFPFLMTAREEWYNADIEDLRKQMRRAYSGEFNHIPTNAHNKVKEFNYDQTGKQIVDLIEAK